MEERTTSRNGDLHLIEHECTGERHLLDVVVASGAPTILTERHSIGALHQGDEKKYPVQTAQLCSRHLRTFLSRPYSAAPRSPSDARSFLTRLAMPGS
jgi:hypothetical protein